MQDPFPSVGVLYCFAFKMSTHDTLNNALNFTQKTQGIARIVATESTLAAASSEAVESRLLP